MPMRRRDVLIAAGAIGLAISVPRVARMFAPAFEFEPVAGLPGFRRLSGGVVSGAGSVFLTGLDPISPAQTARREIIADAPCDVVFGPVPWGDDRLPLAVFTDYYCPFCPTLSTLILEEVEKGTPVRPVWHDLPVLGPRSVAAARMAIAAGVQAKYVEVHRHLMHSSLPPGRQGALVLGDLFGLDAEQLLADAASDATSRKIEMAHDIAAVFGIAGTPATLVGRTLVVGRINRRDFRRLVSLELDAIDAFSGCR